MKVITKAIPYLQYVAAPELWEGYKVRGYTLTGPLSTPESVELVKYVDEEIGDEE